MSEVVSIEIQPDGTRKAVPYVGPDLKLMQYRFVEKETGNPLLVTPGQVMEVPDIDKPQPKKGKGPTKFVPSPFRALTNPKDHMHATLFDAAAAQEFGQLHKLQETHIITRK